MARNDEKKSVRCSFCGKPQSLVNRLVAGNGVYICDECVRLCMSIIDEGYQPESVSTAQVTLRRDQLPKPVDKMKWNKMKCLFISWFLVRKSRIKVYELH